MELKTLTLDVLHESPRNPRKCFDQAGLDELAASIKTKGVLTPLLVRPNKDGFEIASGHRRYRAAKLAGVTEVPALISPMDDTAFLELLVVDNLQREDLTPLEEAEGYKTLMAKAGYDVARIADRIGRSAKYVYDRVKLLALIPAAMTLLRGGQITAGHAILLARLKPKDQQRALDEGTFEPEELLWEPDDGKGHQPAARGKEHRKPVSVRELQAWIDRNIRFDVTVVDPMLFPETAATVTTEKPEAIVPITHLSYIPEEARDGRTYFPQSWKRADAKPCEHVVTGVVVVGPKRGAAFKVCVKKDRCKVHWADALRERKKRATAPAGGGGHADRQRREQERWELERKQEEAAAARWKKALPAILDAIAERVRKAPTRAGGLLAELVIGDRTLSKRAGEYLPRGASAEDLVRHVAFMHVLDDAEVYQHAREAMTKHAKAFGIDVKKILDQAAPAKAAEPTGKKK
jgi:ParB/RepB/Spo0J family partition protein